MTAAVLQRNLFPAEDFRAAYDSFKQAISKRMVAIRCCCQRQLKSGPPSGAEQAGPQNQYET